MGTKISLYTVYRPLFYYCDAAIYQASVINQTCTNRFSFCIFGLLVLLAPLFSGCLIADKKEVQISLHDDGKGGSGRIIFTGIGSTPGDSINAVRDDFNALIAEYYEGRKIEIANPGMKDVRKKLFVKDGKLMGEIDFNFDDIADVGIYRYKDSGPYMYYTVAEGFLTSGQYASSNGTFMGDKLPIIFWDSTARDLSFTMSLASSQEPKQSLFADYNKWLASQH